MCGIIVGRGRLGISAVSFDGISIAGRSMLGRDGEVGFLLDWRRGGRHQKQVLDPGEFKASRAEGYWLLPVGEVIRMNIHDGGAVWKRRIKV